MFLLPNLATSDGVTTTCAECPVGFFFNDVFKCDQSTCDLMVHAGYWPWSINGTPVVIECIAGYCGFNDSDPYLHIPHGISIYDAGQVLCNLTNRKGVLCGSCQEGFGTAINSDSFECTICNDQNEAINWLYYFLSIYLPLIVCFTIIIVFNIRLTTGPANAFILYAQVISTTFDIFTDGQLPLNAIYGNIKLFQIAYQLCYNIFNMQFIGNLLPPFCLSQNLNTLDIVSLKYLEAAAPLFMIIVIVLFLKFQIYFGISCNFSYCHRLKRRFKGRRLGDSITHAFAAFILLSYTRFCLISTFLISSLPFKDQNKVPIGVPRLLYDGDFTVNDSSYIAHYKFPAYFVFATIIAIPPLVLLEYPVKLIDKLTLKYKILRRWYPAASISIVLDTFMGCYKDNRRYFAGIYFLLRLSLYIVYFTTVDDQQIAAQQFVVTVYIVLIAILWPYKRKFFNYVDTLIFLNMATLNILSYYILTSYKITPLQPAPAFAITVHNLLFFLPLCYMVGYLLWYFLHTYIKILLQRYRSSTNEEISNMEKPSGITDDDESLLERAQTINTYQSVPSVSST